MVNGSPMELKLIALTIFVLILIYFNYRRYKRLERQRALLQQARNGLIFTSSSAAPFFRRSRYNLATSANPGHRIAIIFPGSDLSYENQDNNQTNRGVGVNPSHSDLPPSYYDLFSESELKGAAPGARGASDTPPVVSTPLQTNFLPTYDQTMGNVPPSGPGAPPAVAPPHTSVVIPPPAPGATPPERY